MKQKKIGNILYVYSTTAYEITEDTDVTVIKIQEECIPAYAKLNASLVSKFSPINYKLFCVKQPEWADYYDDLEIIIAPTTNGTVTVSPASADMGEEVTITTTPAEGYLLDTLTVMCGDVEVLVVDSKFTMPVGDVTITGTFVSSGVAINPKWYNTNDEEMTSPFVWSTEDYVGLNLKDKDLNIGVTDENGTSIFTTGALVAIWESSDTSVVTIDQASSDALMQIVTQAEGTAIVTATWPAQTVGGVLYAGGSASITIVIQ